MLFNKRLLQTHLNNFDYPSDLNYERVQKTISLWQESIKNGNYENLATTCAMANANSNVLWNVTPIDYVDYVNASRLTSVTINENSVSIYNPSSGIDVWMNVDGNKVKISAGETVTLPIDLSEKV